MTLQPTEKRFLIWLIAAVVVLTSATYIMGWLGTPPGKSYTGINRLTPGDISVYYSFIEQGREGKVVSKNLYTSEAQPFAAVLTPQWFVLGQLANLFHLPTILAYQLSRVGFGILFLILAYQFLAGLIAKPRHRMYAMLALTFATGFGELVPLGNLATAIPRLAIPVDLWVPESFPFISLYHNPLFLMGMCGVLGVLLLFERAQEYQDPVAAWFASGLALILAIIHPYDAFLLAGILVATWTIRAGFDRQWSAEPAKRYLRTGSHVLVPMVLALGLTRIIFALQPALRGWAAQNITLSPEVWWYFPAYLVPVSLAAFGVRTLARMRTTRAYLVLGWALVVPLLLYLPHYPYQRRMMEGWFVALVILAYFGALALWQWLRPHLQEFGKTAVISAALTLAIILTCITSISLLVKDAYFLSYGSTPSYVPSGLITGFTWLRDHTADDAIVLARPFESNLLPGWSGRRVYYGHDDLTANSPVKAAAVDAFFTSRATLDVTTFVRDNHLSYLLLRTTDYTGIAAAENSHVPMTRVYENADVLIYHLTFTR